MNKQKFTQIVKDYQHISAEDRQKLHELVADYPYSQIIHTLIAKANMDAKTSIANKTLGYAAMYASDRSVLKDIIAPKPVARPQATSKTQEEVKPQKTSDIPEIAVGTKVTFNTDDIVTSGADLLSKQVFSHLEALKESKSNYLHWLNTPDEPTEEILEEEKKTPKKKTATKKTSAKSTSTTKKKTTSAKKDSSIKKTATKSTTTKSKSTSKKESKPKASKATAAKAKPKATAKKSTPKKNTAKKAEVKKKETPDQSDIIDQFIAKEPSITAKASRKSPNNQEDLSQPSTEFNEDLVSENLAKILITQGKADKAIDIYKKLIWKFPQKKAYFATQIEELKK